VRPIRPPRPCARPQLVIRCGDCGRRIATLTSAGTADPVPLPRCPQCDTTPPWKILRRRLAAGERAYVTVGREVARSVVVDALAAGVRDLRVTATSHRWAQRDEWSRPAAILPRSRISFLGPGGSETDR
jgi:hypothetical protein